ncbi:PREDICTED: uncharacterized protein LOC108371909 [Rhagoletis zephyria]|uniref:uncharacterized protein LOC108371909 n=1 Tax=Rhagoletis zephyria TaxID=28612 RepID=UPI00081148C9|nr:PREDICTED: uncharacterized protein LOC108371909 [Rhagoletis zephyria]
MDERESEEIVPGGLRLLNSNLVGSLFTQIDTGISYPVDFVPTDYFNRCTARVFATLRHEENSQSSVRITNEVAINSSNNTLSFSRKLDEILEMSEQDELNMPPSDAAAGSSKSAGGGPRSSEVNTEQLSRMMAMMAQNSDMLAQCMTEVHHMRGNMSNINERLAGVEASTHAQPTRAGMASTPENRSERPIDVERSRDEGRASGQSSSNALNESRNLKKIDLDKWHVKFDGSAKGITVESFIFRIEKLREQYGISHYQLFTCFHCLVTGNALKWYWQILEDNADDPSFGYFELKSELLNHFKTAESDYEIIREIMERKQQVQESFEDFYGDVHSLTFRLRKKIPEKELVGIIRGNLKPYLANLTFASKMETLADLKSECKRAEKVMRDNKNRPKQVNEIDFTEPPCLEKTEDRRVEEIGRMQRKKPQQYVSVQPNVSPSSRPNVSSSSVGSFCPSPFHLMLCFTCGMPVDHFSKNPTEAQKDSKCNSSFHNMICFSCGGDTSYCVFKPVQGNLKLAEISGDSRQMEENPENK